MTRFKTWILSNGETEQDAETVTADTYADAAEEAARHDFFHGDYLTDEREIAVRPDVEGARVEVFTVDCELEPYFCAISAPTPKPDLSQGEDP